MIIVDTSVWIDHLRRRDPQLQEALQAQLVRTHPFVWGELACGSLKNREAFLGALSQLPRAPVATHDEAAGFLDRHSLAGQGIGWVDLHLLASTALMGGGRLWSRDKRLAALAHRLGLMQGSEAG